jgi:hypothetical protein
MEAEMQTPAMAKRIGGSFTFSRIATLCHRREEESTPTFRFVVIGDLRPSRPLS